MSVVASGCSDDDEAPAGGFGGGGVPIGTADEVRERIDDGDGFFYVPEARAWVVRYPADALDAAADLYDEASLEGMTAGFLALYQRCTHLGCRVPECTSSKRFECPCHASVFSHVGEYVDGPATRGLDRFPIRVDGDELVIDTSAPIEGLGREERTVDQEPAGPACITS